MGHLLNKVLKDVINRFKLLQGYRVYYTPGWDCHGLPIEQKALAGLSETERWELDAADIRSRAQACALDAMKEQREGFMRWGVMADWGDIGETGTQGTI
jgi:isoleucyl-tRNA synthetase